MTLRVLIVDDSVLVRNQLAAIINGAPDMRVVGSASGAAAAEELLRKLQPDVLTLDVEMPGKSGLEFLEGLMNATPMPVVMVSALTERGSETTLRALELGAVDFVAKPKGGGAQEMRSYGEALREKLRAAAQARIRPRPMGAPPVRAVFKPATPARPQGFDARVIVVGASTGGTEAVREFLADMPVDSPPILVTQHMPETFTKAFAARLDAACALTVTEATHGGRALPGHAYIAPGHSHLLLVRDSVGFCLALSDAPPVNRHRPSVDVLFGSAAEVAGKKAIGVILTGMGKDGAAGMLALRQSGSYNYAQDEASCVVFGMPREAIACGAVHEIAPISEIAGRVQERLRPRGRPT